MSELDGSIDVVDIYANTYTFAAIREDGSVITWDEPYIFYGLSQSEISNIKSELDGTIDVIEIIPNHIHYAAIREDGSVIAWVLFS